MTPGVAVKQAVYTKLTMRCPEPECEGKEIRLASQGGGFYFGTCPNCGLRVQMSTVIQAGEGVKVNVH